ncbi:uncharacterized protein LOC119681093 isoform X1 [Teleopsis dalmanni]|uniref:uncharacterized protein LOC119681093 isoform X1 n=1 Tax=Teleopsis dalmanni TaxID=139649 RepID=UPI0018CC8FF4|nr:uncharacterized protein LOC119681093 isoform X1 [Teleopsis dalmanni]
MKNYITHCPCKCKNRYLHPIRKSENKELLFEQNIHCACTCKNRFLYPVYRDNIKNKEDIDMFGKNYNEKPYSSSSKFTENKILNRGPTEESSESDSSLVAHSSSKLPSPRASMKIGYFVNQSNGEITNPNVKIRSNKSFKSLTLDDFNRPNICKQIREYKPSSNGYQKELIPTKIPVYVKKKRRAITQEEKCHKHKLTNISSEKQNTKFESKSKPSKMQMNYKTTEDSSGTSLSKIPKYVIPKQYQEQYSNGKVLQAKKPMMNIESEDYPPNIPIAGWMTSLESQQDIAKESTTQETQTNPFPIMLQSNHTKLDSSVSSLFKLDDDCTLTRKYNYKTISTQTITKSSSSFTQTVEDTVQPVNSKEILPEDQQNPIEVEVSNRGVILFGAYIKYPDLTKKFFSISKITKDAFIPILLTAVFSFGLGAMLFSRFTVEKQSLSTKLFNILF